MDTALATEGDKAFVVSMTRLFSGIVFCCIWFWASILLRFGPKRIHILFSQRSEGRLKTSRPTHSYSEFRGRGNAA